MLSPILLTVALALFSAPSAVEGRIRWMERDDRAVLLHPRRFGQEHPAVIEKLSSACDGAVCGNLAGQAITPLLAAQGECTQQDMADAIIDASRQFDDATQQNMIALAQEYRQAEKNTPPDFTTNPPANRNSVFCQKAPKNAELKGLVQAQDPANDPDLFFDPATKATVHLGDQANTQPFGGVASSSGSSDSSASASSGDASASASSTDAASTSAAATTAAAAASTTDAASCAAPSSVDTGAAAVASGSSSSDTSSTGASGDIGDFGSCTVPQIEFGQGFDNRKETAFQPVDKASYNHESAQNMDIISQFICDTLTNSCGADDTAKATCQSAIAASKQAEAKTGGQADAFNAVFGISTDFASQDVIDNQGKVVSAGTGSSGSASASSSADASASTSASDSSSSSDSSDSSDASASSADSSATATAASSASSAASSSSSSASTGGADFGSCSTPEIEFGQGFDNRKETSFQPADKTSYDHGSAQAIGIIAQFICDTLTNKCQANQAAKDLCKQAQDAANGGTAKTGGQADAFNAVFGTTTNFADVTPIDDQGREVGAAAGANAQVRTGNDSNSCSADNSSASSASSSATASSTASASDSTSSAAASTAGNLQTFTGALGGVTAPTVTATGDGKFQVEGNSAFNSQQSAVVRSCDVQHNKCANAANSSGNQGDLTVDACGQQQSDCIAQAGGQ
ncbi:hypothetical protein EV121DRAFT_261325 [Schizophyllum commune]